MKKEFVKIAYDNKNSANLNFDIVPFQDVLQKNPKDHSQFEFHKVSFYFLLFLTSGKGKYNLNFKDYNYEKGTLFTVSKNDVHKFYKSDASGVLLIFTKKFIVNNLYGPEVSRIFMLFNEILSSPKVQLKKDHFDEIKLQVDQARKEYENFDQPHSSHIIQRLFQIIFLKLFRIKSNENPLFRNTKELSIFEEFYSSVEKYCFENRKVSFYLDKMNISAKALNRITKAVANASAKSLINIIFIILAKRLIVSSSEPLSNLAYKMGFDEPTNFFKFFKKHCGISPSQFRELK